MKNKDYKGKYNKDYVSHKMHEFEDCSYMIRFKDLTDKNVLDMIQKQYEQGFNDWDLLMNIYNIVFYYMQYRLKLEEGDI